MTPQAVPQPPRQRLGKTREVIVAAVSTVAAIGLGFGAGSALSEDGIWWRSPPAERVIASLGAASAVGNAPGLPPLSDPGRVGAPPNPDTVQALGGMFQSSVWAFVDEAGLICLRLVTPGEAAERCASPREVSRAGLTASIGAGRDGLAALLLPDGLDLGAPPADFTRVGEQAFLYPARVDGSPVPVSFPRLGGGSLTVPRLPSAAHTGGVDV